MGKANLTMQHDRAMPLGLLEWQDDPDALRFRTELSDGAEAGPGADGRALRADARGLAGVQADKRKAAGNR